METKHIFLQLDTKSLEILFILNGLKSPKPDQVLDHTIIYKQGSMSLGNSVSDFMIGGGEPLKKGDCIYFSVLPVDLFSKHKVSFKYTLANGLHGSPITGNGNDPITSKDFSLITAGDPTNPMSFGIQITAEPDQVKTLGFCLNAKFEWGEFEIPVCIDPSMKIKPV